MCPHTAICVRILLHMCPHTATHVSSYCYICVLILIYMCPRTTTYVVLQAREAPSPHTTAYMSSSIYSSMRTYMSSYCYICVLILLYMCPHTTTYVSSCAAEEHGSMFSEVVAIIPLLQRIYVSSYYHMCPHTTIYVSSYYYICVLILLYMCPHAQQRSTPACFQKWSL